MTTSYRILYASPTRFDPRFILVPILGWGTAAIASFFLHGTTPTSLLYIAATPAMGYGGVLLLARRPIRTLTLTTLPVALISSWGARMAIHDEDGLSALHDLLSERGVETTALLVLAILLLFGPALYAVNRTSVERSHDKIDRILAISALWLGLVAFGLAIAPWIFRHVCPGRGNLSWWAPGLALSIGAICAAAVGLRDLKRIRLLRPIYDGKEPLWEIGTPPETSTKASGPQPIPSFGGRRPDGVLLAWPSEDARKRGDPLSPEVTALVPLDSAAAVRFLRRRAATCAMLLLLDAGGAATYFAELLIHAKPLTGIVSVTLGGSESVLPGPYACVRISRIVNTRFAPS